MPSSDVTRLLADLSGGDGRAVDALLPLVYGELQDVAHRQLRRERPNHTLDTVALAHEAYLKLVGQDEASWQNRAHFLGVAAIAMRRILINHARDRRAQKRGGDAVAATFDEQFHRREHRADELVALDEALDRLATLNERQSQVVVFRFFGGLTQDEIAEALGVSTPTVRRDWRLARAWLSRELKRELE